MRNVALRPSAIAVCSIAILCCSVVAHAQSVDTFNPGANQSVNTIAVQPDGKILVGGNFNTLGVGAGLVTRNSIGRFNADGSVDSSFNPGANLNVFALAVQPDGKIVVGGNFSTLGGATRIGIGRLNADGSIDTAFNPGASKLPSPGAPPEIYTIVLQPDGKILLGGYFNGLGGGTGTTSRNFIGRLNADGTVDSFNPQSRRSPALTRWRCRPMGRSWSEAPSPS